MAASTNEKKFLKAAELISASKDQVKLSDAQLLKLYGLYKQGTVGPNNTSKPGFLDPRGRAKWDAWTALGQTSKETAWSEYSAFALELLPSDKKSQLLALS